MAMTISNALQKHFVPDDGTQAAIPSGPAIGGNDAGTDVLVSRIVPTRVSCLTHQLHQFWDPMMLQEQPNSSGDQLGVSAF